MPEEVFKMLSSVIDVEGIPFEKVNKNRYTEKKIIKPKLNSEFCEILGVINGDGHISKENPQICIVGHHLEKQYYTYLIDLFERNFQLKFSLYLNESTFKIRSYSKNMVLYLVKEYNLPQGNKMGKLRIPLVIFKKKKWLRSYLRGLFDTDGCFHVRREKDPMIVITSADPRYLGEVRSALESLGFVVSKGDQRIFLYHKRDIFRFFDEIKPANAKHLEKYHKYLKLYKAKAF